MIKTQRVLKLEHSTWSDYQPADTDTQDLGGKLDHFLYLVWLKAGFTNTDLNHLDYALLLAVLLYKSFS